MSPDPQASDPREDAWNVTLTQAWIENRMELDRTIVALSAGGIGLLVTLLTTVGVVWWWTTLVYAVAIGAFVLSIRTGLAIFERNSSHLEAALTDPDTDVDEKLTELDGKLRRRFWTGVGATILIGVLASAPQLLTQWEDQMNDDKNRPRVTETTEHEGPSNQSSLDKITNLKPKPNPPQDSGGNDTGGNGTEGDSNGK